SGRFAGFGLALALLASVAIGQDQPAASSSPAPDFRSAVLRDAKAGTERQLAEAALVEAEAQRGKPYAQYLLGTLYRLGKRHPAKLFERDDDKAATYLSNAAVHGQVL